MLIREDRQGSRDREQSQSSRSEPGPPQPPYEPFNDRSRQLNRLFYNILEGKWKVQQSLDAQRFIEAICSRPDKSDCIERLASSESGRRALHEALTWDCSLRFMNSWAARLLDFLSDPGLRRVGNGELLNQILLVIIDPPLFWNAILGHAKTMALDSKALEGFAWLLLQMVILPIDQSRLFRETAQSLLTDTWLEKTTSLTAKSIFQKVRNLVARESAYVESMDVVEYSPGGRHDNDFMNYHDISIIPTKAELESSDKPFIRRASEMMTEDASSRAYVHLDNQYRLLREDMIEDMREDIKNMKTGKKRHKGNMVIEGLQLEDIDVGTAWLNRPCGLVLRCSTDILDMPNTSLEQRKRALRDTPAFVKHQSFGCIMAKGEHVAFATVNRNEEQLARLNPCICLVVLNHESLIQVLRVLKHDQVDFIQVSTPLFAYEPILERLRKKVDVELGHDILAYSDVMPQSPFTPTHITDALRQSGDRTDLQQVLGTAKPLYLDESQRAALTTALIYQVASIQGPPGTGKSFVGALIAHVLLGNTTESILVLAYTNHALDKFLEDLMDIGIDPDQMVRLGSKSTSPTEPLLLKNQSSRTTKRSRTRFALIDYLREHLTDATEQLKQSFGDYFKCSISLENILSQVEFHEHDRHFFDAFHVSEMDDEYTRVGRGGRAACNTYLLHRWVEGKDAGPFGTQGSYPRWQDVWQMSPRSRKEKMISWKHEIIDERITRLAESWETYNKLHKTLRSLQKQSDEQILISKRVIACTTTAASMYAQEIQAAAPAIIIVEEAGEIMESHVLAAMGPSTKQLIQIGDHKQLRPKVKSYKLSVESGKGFDLNRSLFERLVLQKRAHSTLLTQHRMRPEISELIRHNYANLQDAQETKSHPHLRGFQSDVIFVNHSFPEEKNKILVDKLDENSPLSKQNKFEAEMVWKCVRYLGQQGYRTSEIVILTPYLGQLSLLRNSLSRDHDPILNDFDTHDLVQAGILPAASARMNKKSIRLSTIDNYQGEESNIVVVSLTRSNDAGDIGFMQAPERLNVLVSRARDALIMIGNAETFMNAKNGRGEWVRLFDNLKTQGKIYDGFPLRCQKHPGTAVIAKEPVDFDRLCPDGGCTEPCSETLACGLHRCLQRCHILMDHSKMNCTTVLTDLCPQKHKVIWECYEKKPACKDCHTMDEQRRAKARREKMLDEKRQEKQFAYARKLKALQDQINHQQQLRKENQEQAARELILEQHRKDLERLTNENRKAAGASRPSKATTAPNGVSGAADTPQCSAPANDNIRPEKPSSTYSKSHKSSDSTESRGPKNDTADGDRSEDNVFEDVPFTRKHSAAEQEWQCQKDVENTSNEALDGLMSMTGLENVKQEFLRIKGRVDTVIRQGADLNDERFSGALLGNPGTGKTTVARLYAKFLSSVGAIPGDYFKETTGSHLANDGVNGCQGLIDEILQNGGGVFFLDEAYQLVSSSSMAGRQVLDFLLAEIENLTGKVVFVFAGYRKQMEDFFAHNPGIPSRIPISLDFQDYEDEELLRIMIYQIEKKYNGRMQVEGGLEGRFMRIVARRIGRGRGREGFGNAREVQNVLSRLLGRQADRLQQQRRRGQTPSDMLLTGIDLIGPPPCEALNGSKAWKELDKMIGLGSVKRSVRMLVDRLQTNYDRELREKPPIECSLNKCFLGNPGTGKTSVAKLYGSILKSVGLLSNGEVVMKNPADFLGSVLGQSEKNTKSILDSTKGKVLIIDEAYMLASPGLVDPYRTAVIDTMVAEIQSTGNEDRCVLLLGYKEQMEDMFRNANPGLSRRFPIASAFHFDDYDTTELSQILDLKLKRQALRAGDRAKRIVLEVLERERHKPNFGNAGAVDIILNEAKDRQQARLSNNLGTRGADVLIAEDIDPDYDRGERAATNIRMLFKDVVGCDKIVQQLEDYQQVALNSKANGEDPRDVIPFSFLFRGPPGTGKTSTARMMGKIYYDMGFLGNASVVECSATDIIGQYVGQTGPKVQAKFDEALGKVLFIDEAYRLAEGPFAKEAMDEIVDCLTKERYQRKLIVILAGYENDINRLMAQNPGLTRRFPDAIVFSNLSPAHCRDLFLQCLKKKRLDITELEASASFDPKALAKFTALCSTPSWGNAGDVQTLARNVYLHIMRSKNAKRAVYEDMVFAAMNTMIRERTTRGATGTTTATPTLSLPTTQYDIFRPAPTTITTLAEAEVAPEAPDDVGEVCENSDHLEAPQRSAGIRDVGVSDEIWAQLELDKAAEQQRRVELDATRKEASRLEKQMQEQTEKLKGRPLTDPACLEELRALEATRLQLNEAAIRRQQEEEDMRKAREMKKKLEKMGRCPVGYEWIQQVNGFRCAGGSHFIANGERGLE